MIYNLGMIQCCNCYLYFDIEEEIDDDGNTAEFDTVLVYSIGEIYEDVECPACDQTFDIKKIGYDEWESLIQY